MAPSSTAVSSTQILSEHEGALRPHLQIPMEPNHGLNGFFRVKTDMNSHMKPRDEGQPEYVALETPSAVISGVFLIIYYANLLLFRMHL